MKLQKEIDKIKEQWWHFFETVEKPGSCIFCEGTRIYWNGKRERTASVLRGDEVVYLTDILCKRVKCAEPKCKRSWTLRPPGLMPRRHYQLCVVAHAATHFLFNAHTTLSSVADAHCCARRTLGRWLNWIGGISELSALIRRVFYVSKEPVSITALKVREAFKKAACTAKKTFLRTAKIFCLLETLAMAYGYQPPGLGRVIEITICNRDRFTTYQSPLIPELAR